MTKTERIAKEIHCTLAENIRRARKKKKYTINTLAALVEVEPETISGYENGRCFPCFPNIVKLIDILDISPNEFFCEKRELTEEEALKFSVEIPKPCKIKPRKRVRLKAGEEPNFTKEMKEKILQNKKIKSQKKHSKLSEVEKK